MKKILIILFVVVVLVSFGVFAFNLIDALRNQSAPEVSIGEVSEDVVEEESAPSGRAEYESSLYNLAFLYDQDLFLFEREVGTDERPQHAVVLVEDTEDNRDVLLGRTTEPREGPTSITVDIYENEDNLDADAWVSEYMNWILRDRGVEPVTVGGVDGFIYYFDGLYAGKSAVVTTRGYTYVFSVTWITEEDMLVDEYETLLDSVSFTK